MNNDIPRNKPRLLLTRPAEQAQQDAIWFAGHDIDCLMAPMLEYRPVEFEPPDLSRYQGLIITSAQGIRSFAGHLNTGHRAIPVYCVGDQSAQAALDAGYTIVLSASATATELMALIKSVTRSADSHKPFLYVRAFDISVDIQAALRDHGIACDGLVTYQAALGDNLPPLCVQAITTGTLDAIAFTSVRSAQNFKRLVCVYNLDKQLKSIKALCLSSNVLECIQPLEWKGAYVCPHPDGDTFRAFIRGTMVA